jgi:acyl carrier protein
MPKTDKNNIYNFLIYLLEEKGPIPIKNRKNILEYRYLDSAHIDSLGILGFINAIETKFKIKLNERDTNSDEFRYIKGLVKIIQKKLN